MNAKVKPGGDKWCRWSPTSELVKKASSLKGNGVTETISAIYAYVTNSIAYDYDKADKLRGTRGYVPDPEATYEEGSGICFDLASLMCAMLRSQGIEAKLCVGFLNGDSHAWVQAWDGKRWLRCDPTMAKDKNKKERKYVTKYEL